MFMFSFCNNILFHHNSNYLSNIITHEIYQTLFMNVWKKTNVQNNRFENKIQLNDKSLAEDPYEKYFPLIFFMRRIIQNVMLLF